MYCHFSGVVFDDSATKLPLYEKNMTLVKGVIDIFGFTKAKDLQEIKKKVSRDHIAELHKLIAWLWPPDTKIPEFLPAPSNNLRALYMGNMRPETILRSVGRYSLYCDEILVMNPFLNPWFIAPDYNPIIHPEDYVGDTWKWVLFVLQLAPWIQDKQVLLLPNPLDFDSKLRKEMWESAERRLTPHKKEFKEFLKQDDSWEEIEKAEFKRSWLSMPEHAMREKIKESHPKMSEKEVNAMIDYINRMKEADPFFVTNPNEKGAFGIKTFQAGGNLEQGLYIAQLTGAHLYTDFEFRWKEILSIQTESQQESPWSPITYSFQKLGFKFLNNVDLQFIHKIKSDGRLSSFRNFLRKTWQHVAGDNSFTYEQANKLALEFTDELKEQYAKAESEWDDIDAALRKWLLSHSGIGALLVTGGLNWIIPALGFSLEGVGRLLESRYNRNRFRKNVPLSVFVDLRNKKVTKPTLRLF